MSVLDSGESRFLYKLTPEAPSYVTAADLSSKGFSPSGNEYLTFELENTEEVHIKGLDLQAVQFPNGYRNATFPYITDMETLRKELK